MSVNLFRFRVYVPHEASDAILASLFSYGFHVHYFTSVTRAVTFVSMMEKKQLYGLRMPPSRLTGPNQAELDSGLLPIGCKYVYRFYHR